MLNAVTLIVPYYRNPLMLAEQINVWNNYPDPVILIVVDDGSPEPAYNVIEKYAALVTLERLQLYRIGIDVAWNRGGARNLGAHVAETEWIMQLDIDHILPADSARHLLEFDPNPTQWYRLERYRVGKADVTRKKDRIHPDQEYGLIHPHVDSYLCTRKRYWEIGGYDEDYSGCLGGGNPFLKQMEQRSKPLMLPLDIHLNVYTRDKVSDASDTTLNRDSTEYTRRRREKEASGRIKAVNPLRFPWERVL